MGVCVHECVRLCPSGPLASHVWLMGMSQKLGQERPALAASRSLSAHGCLELYVYVTERERVRDRPGEGEGVRYTDRAERERRRRKSGVVWVD